MFLRLHQMSTRATTALVLYAVLAATGVQALELGHYHDATDVAEHCLVCKADSAAAVALDEARCAVVGVGPALQLALRSCLLPGTRSPHNARAPPGNS